MNPGTDLPVSIMKTLKTLLVLAIIAAVVIAALSVIMPKVAFSQKKALWDGYKIEEKLVEEDEDYVCRLKIGKGTWTSLEYDLEQTNDWLPEASNEYFKTAPNGKFTADEIKGFVKEYYRVTKKKCPIEEKVFTEYMAVMKDEENEYYIYYEVHMRDRECDLFVK